MDHKARIKRLETEVKQLKEIRITQKKAFDALMRENKQLREENRKLLRRVKAWTSDLLQKSNY